MSGTLWAAVISAGLVALAAPVALRTLLRRIGTFDIPNNRSSHTELTLRGGGLAPLLGILAGGVWAASALEGEPAVLVSAIVAAAVVTSLVGFTEDICGLPVVIRAALQFAIGAALAICVSTATGIHWLWVPVASLFFAAHVNFTNFMDGVNGISGLHGLVTGLLYSALGVISDLPGLVVIGLITTASFAAFLPWNFAPPPGMFLGDVGSYLLGGVLGATAIAALSAGLHPVAALAPLSVYWADAVTTLLRRAARGEPVFEAHRAHVYQRLTSTGLSHLAAAVIVALFTAAAGGIGLLTAGARIHWAVGALFVGVVLACYLLLPGLRGDKMPPPASTALVPASMPEPTPARSDWAPTTWAVLGATGFIGRSTVRLLTEHGIDVVPLSAPRLELDPSANDGLVVARLAEDHPATVELTGALIDIDVVVNAAGLASPDRGADAKLYGANALLPAVIATAARRAGVGRLLHLSSAAVQGDRAVLDTSADVSPFSPYSRSKALGERATFAAARSSGKTDVAIIRATSVQGRNRPTTEALRRLARSPLASVAAPGDQPSAVSTVDGLVGFVHELGTTTDSLAAISLQPWEGLNVRQVLEIAGDGRRPLLLPAGLCRPVIALGKRAGRLMPKVAGPVRRLEVMWFGQAQETLARHARSEWPKPERVNEVLRGGE